MFAFIFIFAGFIGWSFCLNSFFYIQCFDKYMMKHLKVAAEARGCADWGRAPQHTGHINSSPQDAFFFCDGGEYMFDSFLIPMSWMGVEIWGGGLWHHKVHFERI